MSNPIEEFQTLTGTSAEVGNLLLTTAKQFLDNNKNDLQARSIFDEDGSRRIFRSEPELQRTNKDYKRTQKGADNVCRRWFIVRFSRLTNSGLALMGRPDDEDTSDILQQILKNGQEY